MRERDTDPPIFSLDWLGENGVQIAIILAVSLLIFAMAKLAVRRMRRRLEGIESLTQEMNLQRTATLTEVVSYAIRVVVWTVATLMILGQLGINLGPLLAGAGIVGVALGFGAQNLVKDFLAGFFILLENQFGVGDQVEIQVLGKELSGRVEALDLRTTEVRSFEGTLHTIPNGNIIVSGNRSRGWARAIVDVGVAYDEDVDRVRGILEELFEEVRREDGFKDAFFEGPKVLGVEQIGEKDFVLRVIAETRPSRRPGLESELRVRIKRRFDERGVKVPASAG
ncbi:MAG TPA: mechanosensitive ion channel family protein [Actinomycetota bacterium]|nr:mechanosensitive ion channel family protein [Actinomycetota bacterium]